MSRLKAKQTYSKRRIEELNDSETYIQHNRKIYAFASIKVTLSSYDQATNATYSSSSRQLVPAVSYPITPTQKMP